MAATDSDLIGEIRPDGIVSLKVAANGHGDEAAKRKDGIYESTNNSGNASSNSTAQSDGDEDYDVVNIDPSTVVQGSKGGGLKADGTLDSPQRSRFQLGALNTSIATTPSENPNGSHHTRRKSIPIKLQKTSKKGRYLLSADDPEIKEILRRGVEREHDDQSQKRRRSRFSDLVFTRQFTAFDRQNPANASSPFHGFFTLFWLGTFLLLVKIAANNWKIYGSIFGNNEILSLMFHHDVIVLLLTDGALCVATAVSLVMQLAIFRGYLSWNASGWILQNIWQTVYLGATISWTIHREWPWTHTVFIVLHAVVYLMKMHSFAFYNGYLSEVYKRKLALQRKLKQLDELDRDGPISTTCASPIALVSSYFEEQNLENLQRRRYTLIRENSEDVRNEKTDVASVAAAIESGKDLNADEIDAFERIVKLEIDGLDEDLKGKCSDTTNIYPRNLNLQDFAGYIPLPTVVYELEYPRQEHIDWYYVAEKTFATFGVIGVMIVISQAFIYPVVMTTLDMKEAGMPIQDRMKEFPWILSDLLFPFMMEYLLAWYVIWECILNLLAELTRFADRGFYADWWNSVSWDQFARDWNRPVHKFLLRHVYHSSISAFEVSRSMATLITFLLSACIHELIMWCIFKKLRGYLMVMQMLQLPLVALSRTKWMKERLVLGNLVFWLGIFTGPSFLCSLYLII